MSADTRLAAPSDVGRPVARRPGLVLGILAAGAVLAVVAFVLVGIEGSWAFAVPFRLRKVAAMAVVAAAIGVSTVLFQTITANRILTPSILGFDSLYVLLHTAAMFFLGVAGVSAVDPRVRWLVEVAAMILFATLLFRWLLGRSAHSLYLLVLVGVVFGVLFRSASSLLQRMLDPTAFAVLQDDLFATFNAPDEELLAVSAVVTAAVVVLAARRVRVLDVLALGEATATGLGLSHRREVGFVLAMVAALVAVSTALVGPVLFFGLLVANLAYLVLPTHRHAYLLPGAALLGLICLVLGQLVLERVFDLAATLSVVIEFLGGIVFLFLLVKRGVR
ncbi:iron chelate uptake ABC transporter family permease subunit [Naasia sp. SYSU D00057]|uniref:iron chelate uptake ABC transporter family permease subunit n=1 Tax=Naasia sp. SYSU D00057 TaxID=2817380 RepID=UPI001FED85CF|nr:iron chelate uptake ABC transporter family permease subunit [Naasia sp. SYSU D00057]